jgi:hypothetical protein
VGFVCLLQVYNIFILPANWVFWLPWKQSDKSKLSDNETNVMSFSFSLLRIKSLYMFRALLAHAQEALHKRHLVYCVRIMSVGCGTVAANCTSPPEDEQVMLETCRGL